MVVEMAAQDFFPLVVVGFLIAIGLILAKIFAGQRGMSIGELFTSLTGDKEVDTKQVIQEELIEEDRPRIIYKKFGFSGVISGALRAGENPKTGRAIYHLKLLDGSITPWALEDKPYMMRATKFVDAIAGKRPREFEIIDDDVMADVQNTLSHKQLQVSNLQNKIESLLEDDKKRLFKTAEHQNAVRRTMWSGQSQPNYYGLGGWRNRYTRRSFVPPPESDVESEGDGI
jgi:hypothetical protein